jgi:cytochrome c-type biogenesis protein CcsB
MEILTNITIFLYMVGTAGYFAYLFFQKDYLQRTGYGTLCAGFIFHSASIALEYYRSGHFPVSNLNETLLIAAWSIVGVYLWIQYKYHLKILGIYAAPLAAFIMVMAVQFSRVPAQTKNIFNSFWFLIHILGVFIGEAAFALACGLGILYLVQEHAIKAKTRGFFYKRLPSLELLDLTGHACVIIGFIMLTLGLITGFVYAKSLWGRLWSGDPKEIWSGVTWLIYAALIHLRFTVGWQGRKSAVMAIIGFAAILFTFFGVIFLLQGHHG